MPWRYMHDVSSSVDVLAYPGPISGFVGLGLVLIALLTKGSPGKRYSLLGMAVAAVAFVALVASIVGTVGDMSLVSEGFSASLGEGLVVGVIAAMLGVVAGLVRTPAEALHAPAGTETSVTSPS